MTMVQLLPLAATTSKRSWMTDLSTTRGRPRESAVKTQEGELRRGAGLLGRAGTGAGKPGCREPAAGKGLPWSRALVTLNPRPVLASMNGTGNGAANGGGLDFKLPAEDQIRFRGVQQEIPHFGAPPKRTESLYMKPGEAAQPQLKAVGSSAMQR